MGKSDVKGYMYVVLHFRCKVIERPLGKLKRAVKLIITTL